MPAPPRPSVAARQADLLDWQPPLPVVAFPEDRIRARSVQARISRGISEALREHAEPREVIADRMSFILGERVSRHMLDAYASAAREEHVISLPRFAALLHAVRDRRLLEMLAEPLGWTVIERRYLPLIELAQVEERRTALARQAAALRRKARAGGVL